MAAKLTLDFYNNDNLALKRRKMKDLAKLVRSKFNVSSMEVADFDELERCVFGFSAVGPESWADKDAQDYIRKVCSFIDSTAFARVTSEDWEIYQL